MKYNIEILFEIHSVVNGKTEDLYMRKHRPKTESLFFKSLERNYPCFVSFN